MWSVKIAWLFFVTHVIGVLANHNKAKFHTPLREGIVEEYLEARSAAENEISEFMEEAEEGALPDPHTQIMDDLREKRNKLLHSKIDKSTLEELLDGDPGLANEEEGNESTSLKRRAKRTIERRNWWRWEGFYVPYWYKDDLSPYHRNEAQRTMQTYERYTCMRFVQWEKDENGTTTNEKLGLNHPGHLVFQKPEGCWAYQGNERKANGQLVSCCSERVCVHEIGHALGMLHEQQTPNPDKDRFIRINDHFVASYGKSSYDEKSPSDFLSTGYDLNSNMHYEPWMMNGNLGPTFTRLFPELKERGSYYYLMKEVSQAHGCQNECSDFKIKCENDGYLTKVDGKCACLCIAGLDPAYGCTRPYQTDQDDLEFPGGHYALPMPAEGCPKGTWATGQLTHYNEGGNSQSSQYPLDGEVSGNKATHKFCVMDSDPTDTIWPGGNYCIYRRDGTCPEGFTTGSVQYDDQDSAAESNTKSGELPDGVFGEDTKIEFCCRNTGFSKDELYVPSRKPFVLIKHRHKSCPAARGMRVSTFSHTIKNVVFNGTSMAKREGEHPIKGDDPNFRTEFCSYKPAKIDCGGIFQLDSSNKEITLKSPSAENEDLECYWLIKAPKGQTVAMDFTEFDIRGDPGRCKDDLEVRYSRQGQPGLKYCGRTWDKTTISINNTIHIRLSTYGKSSSHFTAKARLIGDSDLCYAANDRGLTYVGTVNFTRHFEPCLPWHEVTHCEAHPFNLGISNVNLDGNYCRLPSDATGFMPWCFTHKFHCLRNYCDVCQIGKPYDDDKHCEDMKKQGNCYMKGCAKTCKDELLQVDPILTVGEITCGKPQNVSDAHPTNIGNDTFAVGDVVVYKCNDKENLAERRCLSNGKWSDLGFVCSDCPDDWHKYNDTCYGQMHQSVGFDEAVSGCKNIQATLIMPKTQELQEILRKVAPTSIWLGLTDREKEGTWKWIDGDDVSYSNWAGSEPNNWANSEDCAATQWNGPWNDLACRGYNHDFVCTKPSTPVTRCLDFTTKCQTWFELRPTFCKNFPEMAEKQCQKTCALCNDAGATCPVDRPGPNVLTTSGDKAQISQAEVVNYACADGYTVDSGNEIRGCRQDGKLSGSPLKCSTDCPSNWTLRQENNFCYRTFEDAKTYQDAHDHCVSLNGALVSINDPSENDFVGGIKNPGYVWIGCDDRQKEGSFQWIDGTPLLYTNWNPSEPNNWGNQEDCSYMTNSGGWNDISCSKKYQYICKMARGGDDKDNATTLAPTPKPTTPAPTQAPTTPAPTQAPTTPAPTQAPTTPAPTTLPPTQSPTMAPPTTPKGTTPNCDP